MSVESPQETSLQETVPVSAVAVPPTSTTIDVFCVIVIEPGAYVGTVVYDR